jgi:hypothetical protein
MYLLKINNTMSFSHSFIYLITLVNPSHLHPQEIILANFLGSLIYSAYIAKEVMTLHKHLTEL